MIGLRIAEGPSVPTGGGDLSSSFSDISIQYGAVDKVLCLCLEDETACHRVKTAYDD